jgi:hypothetical protein
MPILKVGDRATKVDGDYRFVGEVRAVFTKCNGVIRYVIENDDGILHIFSAATIQSAVPKSE